MPEDFAWSNDASGFRGEPCRVREQRIQRDIWTFHCWTSGGVDGATFCSADGSKSFSAGCDDLIKAGVPSEWMSRNEILQIPANCLPRWIKEDDPALLPAPFIADGLV